MSFVKKLAGYSLLGAAVVLLDRCTKAYALHNFSESHSYASWLSFDLTFNRGISWGMLHSQNELIFKIVTGAIIMIALILFGYTANQFKKGHSIVGETLVLAGAVSNIVDRVLYDGVIDFIIITLFNFAPFGVFNIADICIVGGVGLMVITGFKNL